jgi:DNA-binding transcriptional MerR regulator
MLIKDLAKQTGTGVDTIRHYERIGLLSPPIRTKAGHRHYNDADAQHLTFIKEARSLGFSLHEVRQLLALARAANDCVERMGETQERCLAQIREKIFQLRQLEQTLTKSSQTALQT